PARRTLHLGDERLHLGLRAFDILRVLVERAGTVVSSDELVAMVWHDVVVEEANLRVQMSLLRKVLAQGEDGHHAIETVFRGYCFTQPVSRSSLELAMPSHGNRAEHNLPALLTATVGRDDEIELLSHALAEQRLITVTGPGGVGKTTVALAVAQRCLPLFSCGIRFVDFSAVSDPCRVACTVASALGIETPSDDPLSALGAHLHGKRMLLFLDTCEHIVEPVAMLAETLLSRLPEIRILVTSREILRATGEWAHRLPSLAQPAHTARLSAAEALSYAAVDLFVQRARASAEPFELADADADIVAEICRRLDGMPLAIEFAAARVGELGLREIGAHLDDRFGMLTQGRRTALPRHKTLAATWDWSYDLLPPEEQVMLRRLSVFCGAFTADAAAAVTGDGKPGGATNGAQAHSAARMHLSNLFAKSLVLADVGGETPRYRLTDTTRAFAAMKLAASGESDAVSRRHAAYRLSAAGTGYASTSKSDRGRA
ncbi:MAG TPA: winged helix-turn-helix domain-containing protein, partial [Polyangiaceae bacterium]|nr:winged helix-turn-helix domain-containing protein [Polyangiaceae bacterium]